MLKEVPFLLASALAATIPVAAAATTARPTAKGVSPETIVELRGLLSGGQCTELLARLASAAEGTAAGRPPRVRGQLPAARGDAPGQDLRCSTL